MDKIAITQIHDYETKKQFLEIETADGEDFVTGIKEYADLGFYIGIHYDITRAEGMKLLDALKAQNRTSIIGELQTVMVFSENSGNNPQNISGEILFLIQCDIENLLDFGYAFMNGACVSYKTDRRSNSDLCKKLRKEKGLTQAELAEKTGLGIATIQRLETGKDVSESTIRAVSEFFGISPSNFANLDNE